MNQAGYLKFGVLCNSTQLQYWQEQVILRLIEDGHKLVIVVMPENEPNDTKQGIQKLLKYPYRNFLFRIYFRFLLKPGTKQLVDAEYLFKESVVLRDKGTKDKNFYVFSKNSLEAIRQSGAQFILRFGFGLIKGEILNITPYGIWSFHHDDPEVVRGVPSNFWEIYKGYPTNGAILQKLSEKIDAGLILKQGWFPTILHSWEGNINQAYFGSIDWPAQVCRDILLNGDRVFQTATKPNPGKLCLAPQNIPFLKFLLKMGYYRLRYHFRELFCAEQWVTGITKANPVSLIEGKLDPEDFIWLKNRNRNEYRADPSGWFDGAQLRLFYEYYNYSNPKGSIFTTTYNENGKLSFGKETIALNESTHLAFPFIFNEDQKVYCIPETSEKNQIELYEWDDVKGRFLFKKVLIGKIRAVDTIAFRHKGYWWLLFTVKERSNYELHAWYSPALMGLYQPHALNPVKTDIRSARPAGGIFRYKDKIIRPAQNCSPYSGKSVVLNEIEELSPTAFRERVFKEIQPRWNSIYNQGMHTLNFSGPYLIVDTKRHIFVPNNFRNKIRDKFRRLKSWLL